MGAFYDFLREDGQWVTKMFPFGKCPDEIIDDDGVKAKRGWRADAVYISWKDGHEPSSLVVSRREKRTQDNINAGKRGEKEWRARSPKLVTD